MGLSYIYHTRKECRAEKFLHFKQNFYINLILFMFPCSSYNFCICVHSTQCKLSSIWKYPFQFPTSITTTTTILSKCCCWNPHSKYMHRALTYLLTLGNLYIFQSYNNKLFHPSLFSPTCAIISFSLYMTMDVTKKNWIQHAHTDDNVERVLVNGVAEIKCDVSSNIDNDQVLLVVWYKNNLPIYR